MTFTTTKWRGVAGAMLLGVLAATASAQSLTRSYGTSAGAVSAVALTALNNPNLWVPNQFVTAMRNGSGDLELITWLNNQAISQVQRKGTYVGEPILTTVMIPRSWPWQHCRTMNL